MSRLDSRDKVTSVEFGTEYPYRRCSLSANRSTDENMAEAGMTSAETAAAVAAKLGIGAGIARSKS
jgi:hypothetical protein